MKRIVLVIFVLLIILGGCKTKNTEKGIHYIKMEETLKTSTSYEFDTKTTLTIETDTEPLEITQTGHHQVDYANNESASTFTTNIGEMSENRNVYYKGNTYYYQSEKNSFAFPADFQNVLLETMVTPYYPLKQTEITQEKINALDSHEIITYTLVQQLLATDFLEKATLQVLEGSNHQYSTFGESDMIYEITMDSQGMPTKQVVSASGKTVDGYLIDVTFEITNLTSGGNSPISFPAELDRFPTL